MVPETAPAEKRRQQVSESPESGSIIAERNLKEKPLLSFQRKIKRRISLTHTHTERKTVFNNSATLIFIILCNIKVNFKMNL